MPCPPHRAQPAEPRTITSCHLPRQAPGTSQAPQPPPETRSNTRANHPETKPCPETLLFLERRGRKLVIDAHYQQVLGHCRDTCGRRGRREGSSSRLQSCYLKLPRDQHSLLPETPLALQHPKQGLGPKTAALAGSDPDPVLQLLLCHEHSAQMHPGLGGRESHRGFPRKHHFLPCLCLPPCSPCWALPTTAAPRWFWASFGFPTPGSSIQLGSSGAFPLWAQRLQQQLSRCLQTLPRGSQKAPGREVFGRMAPSPPLRLNNKKGAQ